MKTNSRAICAQLLFAVLEQGQSLRENLPAVQHKLAAKDRAWVQEMTFGVLRQLPLLQSWLRPMLNKPLKGQSKIIELLLLVGIYQLVFSRVSPHAAISETVNACEELENPRLKGLVNAVLRNVQRTPPAIPDNPKLTAGLPGWLYKTIQQAYPAEQQAIIDACNNKAPLWLRVNRSKLSLAKFSQALSDAGVAVQHSDQHPDAVIVPSCDVTSLPGFAQGWFAVQDGAAQLAAHYPNAQAGERVLDACAAPGGKTCHIIESVKGQLSVTALDSDAKRLKRVSDNLSRLGHQATLVHGDASTTQWWDGELFDRILIDAPCSATGVIRRHPDIRWLRQATDIEQLIGLQKQILANLWSLLKPGGHLLYATCSIVPGENRQQIEDFLASHQDASLLSLPHNGGVAGPGRQILPGEQQMDGFYYALLLKSS